MENLSLLTKELKESVLDDENLDEATEDLKRSIESDIKGDFKAEKFDELQQNRKTIMMAGVSSARSAISEAKDLMEKVEGQESSTGFKQDKRRDTIDAEHYNNVRKAMEKYRFLYTHFAGLFYGENQANDKIMSVVDLQRSRALQKQQLDVIQEQLPNVVTNAVEDAVDVEKVKSDLTEEVERVEEENQRLKDRLQDLEGRISALQRRQDNQVSRPSSPESSNSEGSGINTVDPDDLTGGDSVKSVDDFEGESMEELEGDEERIYSLATDEGLGLVKICKKTQISKEEVKEKLESIEEKGFDLPDDLEVS